MSDAGRQLASSQVQFVLHKASRLTIFGWFAGLAWGAYAGSIVGLGPLEWAILIVAGMLAASVLIGGGVAVALALASRTVTGHSNHPSLYAWGALISAALAFGTAGPAANALARILSAG